MVKAVDYPRAALPRTLEVAIAVEELGGDASLEGAAESTGHAPGGAFTALVAAAVKYGWLTVRRGRLRTTPALRDLRLAGDDALRRAALARALVSPPLYAKLVDRFAGKAVPEAALPRLLAREYAVPESAATRTARYFVDGARAAGLIEGGILTSPQRRSVINAMAATGAPEAAANLDDPTEQPASPARADVPRHAPRNHGAANHAFASRFTLELRGPGLDSTLEIGEHADLALARALLDRVERALVTREGC